MVLAIQNHDAHIACIEPYVPVDPWLEAALRSVLTSGRLTNHGPHVLALERALSGWLEEDILAVSSGSTAIEIGLRAIQLVADPHQPRALVLPACTYVATLNAVQRANYTPVFCDIDPTTWTLCPDALGAILRSRSDIAVVLPVNVYGVSPDLPRIRALANRAGARVLYDCAHGLGTRVPDSFRQQGAHVTAWSMHATKLLPAGEGGLIASDDPRILESVRLLRNHGIGADPLATVLGSNGKLSELHAAVALASFRRLDSILARRRAHMTRLSGFLRQLAPRRVQLQACAPGVESNAQNLTVLVTDDAGVPAPLLAARWIAALADLNVEARRYFWPPLHHLRRLNARAVSLPVTDAVMPALVCLPLHTEMVEATLARLEIALERSLTGLN